MAPPLEPLGVEGGKRGGERQGRRVTNQPTRCKGGREGRKGGREGKGMFDIGERTRKRVKERKEGSSGRCG